MASDRKLTAERRAALRVDVTTWMHRPDRFMVPVATQALHDALSDLDAADGEIGSLRAQLAVESASVWDVKGRYRADMDHSDAMLADRQATIQRQADEIAGLRAEADRKGWQLDYAHEGQEVWAQSHANAHEALASLRKLCGAGDVRGGGGCSGREGGEGQRGGAGVVLGVRGGQGRCEGGAVMRMTKNVVASFTWVARYVLAGAFANEVAMGTAVAHATVEGDYETVLCKRVPGERMCDVVVGGVEAVTCPVCLERLARAGTVVPHG